MYTILKNLATLFFPSLESTIIVQFFLRDSLVRAPYATSFTNVQTFIRPAFKPSKIDDPLEQGPPSLHKSGNCGDAIYAISRKHNQSAMRFTGIVVATLV